MKEEINIWTQTILTAMTTLWGKIAGFIPNFLAAIVILFVGYFVAKTIGFVLARLLKKVGLDSLSETVGISESLNRAGITLSSAEIVGKLGFWTIMLTFLVTATESLGLPRVSGTIDEFVLYLPKVIAAAVIFIVGLFIAHFVRDLVRGSAEGIGITYAKPLGSAAYGVLFIVISSLAINELEIETTLLNSLISILIAALGIAIALSLGLGTRDLSTNIMAGVYARDLYSVGDLIEFDGKEGVVIQIGTVKTLVKHKNGSQISVANTVLINSTVTQRM